jgi:hypothetical protein
VIPKVLSGKDIVLAAETGSGKTLAYIAPLASLLLQRTASGQLPPSPDTLKDSSSSSSSTRYKPKARCGQRARDITDKGLAYPPALWCQLTAAAVASLPTPCLHLTPCVTPNPMPPALPPALPPTPHRTHTTGHSPVGVAWCCAPTPPCASRWCAWWGHCRAPVANPSCAPVMSAAATHRPLTHQTSSSPHQVGLQGSRQALTHMFAYKARHNRASALHHSLQTDELQQVQ